MGRLLESFHGMTRLSTDGVEARGRFVKPCRAEVSRDIGGVERFHRAFIEGGKKFQIIDGVEDGCVGWKGLGHSHYDVSRIHKI